MDFAAELAERLMNGVPLAAAIPQAARAAGMTREPTLLDVQGARAKYPHIFPLNYKRLTHHAR